MHPRQMRETSRPVRPSLVYSMLAVLHPALPFRGEGSAARAGMGEAGVIGGSLYSPLEAISRGTEGSNPSPSSRQSVSLPQPLLKVENPAFRAGLGSWLADRVSRDSLGVSISRQPAAISLSGHIPVPRCGWSWRRA